MKPSLTNESAGALFEQPKPIPTVVSPRPLVTGARSPVLERTDPVVRDGFSIARWNDALPLWRNALANLSGATLYHSERWIEALRSCYPIDLRVATLHRGGELRAACVFARSRGWLTTRLVSLPFSDSSEPLALDEQARFDFLRALTSSNEAASFEIRGASAPSPWESIDCFWNWSLDLSRPFREIHAGFNRNVRNGVKRARREQVQIERGTDIDGISRFFRLQLETRRRLGIPPQPFRFFSSVHEQFSRNGDCEIRFATRGRRDLAGLIFLRDGDHLYYKWGARSENGPSGANHLLVVTTIEEFAGKARLLDLGRCDFRNQGLVRSKTDLGCVSKPLPYAFFPHAPRYANSEVLGQPAKLLSAIWKRLPLPVTQVLGEVMYRYMA